jgi:hypothetical protein
MGYQEKYLKYKKKYIELKSTHNMKGGVDPDSFIGKNNPQQQPILLNFKELGDLKCRLLINTPFNKCLL